MVEILIIAVLVLWSTLVVFKKVFPKTHYKVCNQLANVCQQQGWQTLEKWLKPKAVMGCGGGCGCSTDEKETKKSEPVQTVKWR